MKCIMLAPTLNKKLGPPAISEQSPGNPPAELVTPSETDPASSTICSSATNETQQQSVIAD